MALFPTWCLKYQCMSLSILRLSFASCSLFCSYIPEGWYHATFNTARPATLSVAAQQRNSVAPYMQTLNAAHAASPAEAVEMLLNLTRVEQGARAYADDPTLWYQRKHFIYESSNLLTKDIWFCCLVF